MMVQTGVENLGTLFGLADADDRREGRLAYERYHQTMCLFAEHYDFPLERVVAAFVSLSPNSDYHGNLRSLASVLRGIRTGLSVGNITVSTYKHCRDRAYHFALGEPFETPGRGPKITAFYNNILNPDDDRFVTIDGHIALAYAGLKGTMKDAKVGDRLYREITQVVKHLAFREHLVPCEMQAILWFARKRLLAIKYEPQLSLFADATDKWNTLLHPRDIEPYQPNKEVHDDYQPDHA